MEIKKTFVYILLAFFVITFLNSCGSKEEPYDNNISVPKGDPNFPPLTTSWIIDKANVLSKKSIVKGDAIFEQLKQEGIAEIVLVVINDVKHPEDYATHYGRWLGLGKKGLSTEAGNNGLVWLIRPDADEKVTVSVGRGLPRFTSNHYTEIMVQAKDYLNFNNFDAGVTVIVTETDKILRKIYGK